MSVPGNSSAMRVPIIHYRRPQGPSERKADVAAACMLSAGILASAAVWALAIAKLVDLYSQM
jgi:hypothetical protein